MRTCSADQRAPRVTRHVPSPCMIESDRPTASDSAKPAAWSHGAVAARIGWGVVRETSTSAACGLSCAGAIETALAKASVIKGRGRLPFSAQNVAEGEGFGLMKS